jgi:hypothetical protein
MSRLRFLPVTLAALALAQNAAAQPAPATPPPAAPGEVTVTPPPGPGEAPPPIPIAEPSGAASASAAPTTDASTTKPELGSAEASGPQDATGGHGAAPTAIAGYFPGEGFALKSTDGQFKLRIGLQAAYRFEPYWLDGEPQNRRTFFVLRPFMEGHVFRDWIRFWTSFEFAANPPYLLDSFIELQPIAEFGARIGQQWSPYSRHEYFGPQQILFPEWAIVADYFWPGRDKGITLMGTIDKDAPLEYWAGAYSGTPLRQFTAIDGNYVLVGRVTWSPLGPAAGNEALYITSDDPVPFRASFTLQGYVGNLETATENFNPTSFRFDVEGTGERTKQNAGGADIWLQGERFTFLVEANIRHDDPDGPANARREFGVWGQLGYMLIDRRLDVSVRGNYLDPSNKAENDKFYSIEGQLGYYPFGTQNLVLKLRYGYGHQDQPSEEDLAAVRLPVPAGDNQILTAQLGLAF